MEEVPFSSTVLFDYVYLSKYLIGLAGRKYHPNETTSSEKTDPEIPSLYAVIDQQFYERVCRDVVYVNREQDLGEPGLRQTKLSYHLYHLVEKFRVGLA